MVNNNGWVVHGERIVEQFGVLMPPTWLPTAAKQLDRVEQRGRVFQSGPEGTARRRMVDIVNQARQRVVAASFLIADAGLEDALLAAARRGVRVYVLLASEARLAKEPSEGEFDRRVLKEHWEMLERLGGHVLFRSAPHFHAKVLVVDPEENPQGMLSTANFTKEALTRNEEMQVELTSAEVADVIELLGWAMWETAEHEWTDPKDRFRAVKATGRQQHPSLGGAVVATTALATTLRAWLINMIDGARASLVISGFGFDLDHDVLKRICARAREGIAVTVLARVRAASMPAMLEIVKAGGRVLGFNHLHGKAVCVDARATLVMTANLQADGLDRGFEIGLSLSDERANGVRQVLESWVASAVWELQLQPLLGDAAGVVRVWRAGKLEDQEIREVDSVDLGTVVAESADDLASAQPTASPMGPASSFAKKMRLTWRVEPPVLAPKAEEVRRPPVEKGGKALPYQPPVYREEKRKVVAIRSHAELEAAKRVREEVGAVAIVLAGRSLLS